VSEATAGDRRKWSAAGMVLASGLLFGTTGTARALGLAAMAPQAVGGLRIALGGALLVVLALALGRGTRLVAVVREAPLVALVAAAAVACYQVCFFSAVAATGVALGTVVAIGSGPVLAGALGLAIGERPTRRWAAATALAVAGVAVLTVVGRQATVAPAGVLLALGAGASYAALTVAGRGLVARGHPGADALTVFFGAGALLLLPAWLGQDLRPLASPRGALAIVWLGAGATAFAYLLFAGGLRRLPAATVTTLGLAEPLTAACLGVLVLAERPAPEAWLGAALVGAGLLAASAGPGASTGAGPPGRLPAIPDRVLGPARAFLCRAMREGGPHGRESRR
jgi:drug/metabolite transporter, DME family